MNTMVRGTLLTFTLSLATSLPILAADEEQAPAAQTTPAAPAPAPAPAPTPQKAVNNWTWKGIKLSGVLDGYYAQNYNDPASGKNATRAFDTESDSWDLNMLKFAIEKSAEPVGFRFDLGLGRAFDIFQVYEPTRRVDQLTPVMQAYFSFKPKSWNGLQIDFGKFYTNAGAELTESHLNWNYSRGLLYNNGPYFHFGLRATKPVSKEWTLGVQLVNGWNNVADNNSGKTVGFTTAYTKGKVTWANTYYVGPEKTKTNEGFRHFYDTALTVNTSEKNSFYMNFDYGVDRGIKPNPNATWVAFGFADRFALTKKIAVSARGEVYDDRNGFITGTAQTLKSLTFTGEYKFVDGLLTRLEFRRDMSDQGIFDRRAGLTNIKSQNTLVIGLIGYFGPKS